jgi:hypothetical protein
VAFWALILAVIGADLWWAGTPTTFELWWVPLIVLNGVCFYLIVMPLVRGSR